MSRLILKLTSVEKKDLTSRSNPNIIFVAACSIYPFRKVLKSAMFAGPNPPYHLGDKKYGRQINLTIFDLPGDCNPEDEFELKLNIYQIKKRGTVWKNMSAHDLLYNSCDKLNYNGILHPDPSKQLSAFVPQLISRAVSSLHLQDPVESYSEDAKNYGTFLEKVKNGHFFQLSYGGWELCFEWSLVEKRYLFETEQFECLVLNEYDDEIYCTFKADDCALYEGFSIKQFNTIGDSCEKKILKTYSENLKFTLLEADSGFYALWDRDDMIGSAEIKPETEIENSYIAFSGDEGSYKIKVKNSIIY